MELICAFVVLAASTKQLATQNLNCPRESEVNANYAKYVVQNFTKSGNVATTGVESFQLQGVQGTRTILSSEAVQRGDVITVVGVLLVCRACALLFEEGVHMRILLSFAFGICTHYALDGLWIHVSGACYCTR
ncbi:MAG: hypothetical protein WCB79_00595 [Halobacteriota archaeon]